MGGELKCNGITVSVVPPYATERERVTREFLDGSFSVLVTTDVFPRMDVQQISVVVNFDLPVTAGDYLHRVGRSNPGGIIINILSTSEVQLMKDIERYHHTAVEELPQDFMDLI